MALLLNLYLGHLLGDFVFQPGRLVLAKREGLPGQVIHIAIVGVCTALVLVSDLLALWPVVLLAMLAHLAIERLTIYARTAAEARSIFVFVFDQTLHVLSMFALVGMAGSMGLKWTQSSFGLHLDLPVLAAVCGIATVAFAGSIFAFESSILVSTDADDTSPVVRFDGPRILGMVERTVAFLLALGLGVWATPAAFVPRILASLRLHPAARKRELSEAAAGLLLCLFVYVFVSSIGVLIETMAS